MSTRFSRLSAAVAGMTLAAAACSSDGTFAVDERPEPTAEESAGDEDPDVGAQMSPTLTDASVSYVAGADEFTLVLEVQNDGDDTVAVAAPDWEGTDGFVQVASSVLPWEAVLQDEQWGEDDLLEEDEVAPDDSIGLLITLAVDCAVEPEGDVVAPVTGVQGEAVDYRFSDADELAAEFDEPWENHWYDRFCGY